MDYQKDNISSDNSQLDTSSEIAYTPLTLLDEPRSFAQFQQTTTVRTNENLALATQILQIPEKLSDSKQRFYAWLGPILMTLLAAVLRFFRLGYPHALVFDETYYVKDAQSLLQLGYAGTWPNNADEIIASQTTVLPDPTASYVVHPPLGKWMMAIGQWLLGFDNSASWRLVVACFGVASVLLLGRIAYQLTNSAFLATICSGFMAIDGLGIVLSRTGLLDGILTFWVLAGFWAILKDRWWTQKKLARLFSYRKDDTSILCLQSLNSDSGKLASNVESNNSYLSALPILWMRPFLLLAGLFWGIACSVKWSALYAIAIGGIIAFIWEYAGRLKLKEKFSVLAAVFRSGFPAFINLIPLALVTYLASWTSWFISSNSYMRGTTTHQSWWQAIYNAISNLWHYHLQMWDFHVHLSSAHPYAAPAWKWLWLGRPTSFYWQEISSSPHYVSAISAIGNPLLWWISIPALGIVVYWALRHRDWRAWFIFSGYLAIWVPWLFFYHRTIFEFYAIVFLPFTCLAVTFLCGTLSGYLKPKASCAEKFDPGARLLIIAFFLLIATLSLFWFPIWTGIPIPYWFWKAHMWFTWWV